MHISRLLRAAVSRLETIAASEDDRPLDRAA
jgi:hypothetical protein